MTTASNRVPWLREGLPLVAALALAKLILHLATAGPFGYSYFVDELYYLACSEHLAWGFVDMPPLYPALTALVRATLGDSLLAVRLVPALAGAGLVVLTGFLARELGGGRCAQGLSCLAVITAPIFLVMHGMHTMNTLEPLFWTACVAILVRIVAGGNPRLWLLFGALTGVGLNNKHSMAFFGVAALVAILATSLRRAFAERWIWLGGALAFLLFLPNFIWLVAHRFPHFEMLWLIGLHGRDVALSPIEFLAQQVLMLHPVALPLWLGGLVYLLFDREGSKHRILAWIWLGILAEMLLLNGRVYYSSGSYPMLLAAGAVGAEKFLARRPWRILQPIYASLLVAAGAVLAPLWIPCLPPESLIRYMEATGLNQPRIENHRLGALPQLFADRFGWREMAEVVASVYHSLPPEERAKTAIIGQNYGQAGAVDLFGPRLGLPKAVSGHLAYHSWGPRDYSGEIAIVMDDDEETLRNLFASVEKVAEVRHPYSMPYENFDVYLCRGLREPLATLWPRLRNYG